MSSTKCQAWITIGDGPRIQCMLDDPHPGGCLPDIHVAQMARTASDGHHHNLLIEWPLMHIHLEEYAAKPAYMVYPRLTGMTRDG